MSHQPNYSHDVFASFADDDRDWVEGYLLPALGLPPGRIITNQRTSSSESFRPGAVIVNEFERAVACSRFTVLVLSRAYFADQWSVFGEQLSSFASVVGNRDRLIPLLLERDYPLPLHIEFRVSLDCTVQSNWEAEIGRLRELLARPEPKPERIACPYPGMIPFQKKDSRFFYGREEEIREALMGFRNQRLLFVIGPSGCGKSSFVFAGLLPELQRSAYFDEGFWLIREMRPGLHPLKELSLALGGTPDKQSVTKLLGANAPARCLLLVVDQFEELFSQAERSEQNRFIAVLNVLRTVENCALLITMRADFYPELMNSDLWREAASHRREIAPLRGEALRAAIEKPAGDVAVYLEKGLADRLVRDAAEEPGALPLLQETMRLLWAEMTRRFLPMRAYQKLGGHSRSGLAVAIAQKANETLNSLPSDEHRAIARRVFLRLVQFGEGRPDTRRQQTVSNLRSGDDPRLFDETLKHLESNRLITPMANEGGQKKVDLAHEALITDWPQLNEWLKQRRIAEQIRRRLEAKAEEWVRLQRKGGLMDDVEIREAEQWIDSEDYDDLGGQSIDFRDLLQSSRAAVEQRHRQEEEFRRRELEQAQARAEESARAAHTLRNALARTLWQDGRQKAQSDPLLSLHLMTEAAITATDSLLQTAVMLDHIQRLPTTQLLWSADVDKIARPADADSFDVAVRNDELGAVTCAAGKVQLWLPLARGTVPRDLATGRDHIGARFNDSGNLLVLWTAEGDVDIMNATTGRMANLSIHHDHMGRAEFCLGDTAVATLDGSNAVCIWQVKTGKLLGKSEEIKGRLKKLRLSRGGSHAFITLERKEYIYDTYYTVSVLWDFRARRALAIREELEASPEILGDDAIFNEDGQALLTWMEHEAWIVDLNSDVLSNVPPRNASDGNTKERIEKDRHRWANARGAVLRHGKEMVDGAQFTADAKRVVTWTTEGIIRIWDLNRPDEPLMVFYFGERLTGASLEVDDSKLCVLGVGGRIGLWDLKSTNSAASYMDHGAALCGIRLNRRGDRLLSWGKDGAIRLWDSQSGLQVVPAMIHANSILGALFTLDESRVLTWSSDGTLRFWAIPLQRTLQSEYLATSTLRTGETALGARYSFDEDPTRLLTWSGSGILAVWDLMRGTYVLKTCALRQATELLRSKGQFDNQVDEDDKFRIAFNHSGTRIVTYKGEDMPKAAALLWDTDSGHLVRKLKSCEHVAFNQDGNLFVTWNGKKKIRIWISKTGLPTGPSKILEPPEGCASIRDLAMNGAGDRLAVVAETDDFDADLIVRLWDPVKERYVGSHVEDPKRLCFDLHGDHLVVLSGRKFNNHVVFVKLRSGRVIGNDGDDKYTLRMDEDNWDTTWMFDASGTRLFAAGPPTTLWDILAAKPIRKPAFKGLFDATRTKILLIEYSKNASSGDAVLVDALSGKRTGVVLHHGHDLHQIFRHDIFALTVGDQEMKLWNLETGSMIGSSMQLDKDESVDGVVVSNDGFVVLTWGKETVRLRSSESGLQIGPVMEHGSGLDGAAMNDQFGLIVSWGYEGVRFWETASCELLNLDLSPEFSIDGAFFVPEKRLCVTFWGAKQGIQWDLSESTNVDPDILRTRIHAVTGTEYDARTKRIRALPKNVWEAQMARYAETLSAGPGGTG